MRQKAVSIAPQNEAPIQIAPIAARHAERGRAVADPVDDAGQRVLLSGGEDALEVAQDARLDVGVLDHLAEDEQDQQREREQRQGEVVGDHRREAGDVLAVGALPEDAQETGRAARGPPAASLGRGSLLLSVSPAGPRGAAREPDPDRRRLRRGRDAGPRDVLQAAAPAAPPLAGAGSGGGLRRRAAGARRLRLRLCGLGGRRRALRPRGASGLRLLRLAPPRRARAPRAGARAREVAEHAPLARRRARGRSRSSLIPRIPARSADARVEIAVTPRRPCVSVRLARRGPSCTQESCSHGNPRKWRKTLTSESKRIPFEPRLTPCWEGPQPGSDVYIDRILAATSGSGRIEPTQPARESGEHPIDKRATNPRH